MAGKREDIAPKMTVEQKVEEWMIKRSEPRILRTDHKTDGRTTPKTDGRSTSKTDGRGTPNLVRDSDEDPVFDHEGVYDAGFARANSNSNSTKLKRNAAEKVVDRSESGTPRKEAASGSEAVKSDKFDSSTPRKDATSRSASRTDDHRHEHTNAKSEVATPRKDTTTTTSRSSSRAEDARTENDANAKSEFATPRKQTSRSSKVEDAHHGTDTAAKHEYSTPRKDASSRSNRTEDVRHENDTGSKSEYGTPRKEATAPRSTRGEDNKNDANPKSESGTPRKDAFVSRSAKGEDVRSDSNTKAYRSHADQEDKSEAPRGGDNKQAHTAQASQPHGSVKTPRSAADETEIVVKNDANAAKVQTLQDELSNITAELILLKVCMYVCIC